jgi:hypothetical protein
MTLDRVTQSVVPLSSPFRFNVTSSYALTIDGDIALVVCSKRDPSLGDGVVPLPPNYAWLQNKLLVEAHNQALEPDFDTPLFLAELGETLSMLRNPLKAIKKFVKRKKSVKSLLEMTSSQWLQYRYGILPLLGDLDDACQAVTRSAHRYANVLRKSSAYDILPVSTTTVSDNRTLSNYVKFLGKVTVKDDITVTCSRYYLWSENVYTKLYGQNVSLASALGLVWELIPYSFVVDWFLGVGDYVATFRNDPRIVHKGYTATVKRTYSKTWVPTHVSYTGKTSWKSIPSPGYYTWQIERKSRTTPSLPAWPVVNWDFSNVLHIADGLSLLFQQITGKRS